MFKGPRNTNSFEVPSTSRWDVRRLRNTAEEIGQKVGVEVTKTERDANSRTAYVTVKGLEGSLSRFQNVFETAVPKAQKLQIPRYY